MIVLTIGGPDLTDRAKVCAALDYWRRRLPIGQLVHAGRYSLDHAERGLPWAQRRRWGADFLVQQWAEARGVAVVADPLSDADWKKFGSTAQSTHSTRMLMKHRPERVLALPGGVETTELLDLARRAGVKCIEVV